MGAHRFLGSQAASTVASVIALSTIGLAFRALRVAVMTSSVTVELTISHLRPHPPLPWLFVVVSAGACVVCVVAVSCVKSGRNEPFE